MSKTRYLCEKIAFLRWENIVQLSKFNFKVGGYSDAPCAGGCALQAFRNQGKPIGVNFDISTVPLPEIKKPRGTIGDRELTWTLHRRSIPNGMCVLWHDSYIFICPYSNIQINF